MNTAIQTECTCNTCPGAGCACGCQDSQLLQGRQKACACGPQCQCGSQCTCATADA